MPFDMKKYQKEYKLKNKEKLTLQSKEYRLKNKEKLKLQSKEYQLKNKEKITLKMREYRKNHPEYRKRETIYYWKRRGVISDDFDKLYEYYLSIDECENCGFQLNQDLSTRKCLDHCHETGEFRNILCNYCNFLRY